MMATEHLQWLRIDELTGIPPEMLDSLYDPNPGCYTRHEAQMRRQQALELLHPVQDEINEILNLQIDNLIAREWVHIRPYAVGAPNHRKLRLNRIRRLRRALA
jgi:hypothetical protein